MVHAGNALESAIENAVGVVRKYSSMVYLASALTLTGGCAVMTSDGRGNTYYTPMSEGVQNDIVNGIFGPRPGQENVQRPPYDPAKNPVNKVANDFNTVGSDFIKMLKFYMHKKND